MTRGNQRDNDRAKALKKAGNTVRIFSSLSFPYTADPFTEEQKHPNRHSVPEDQGRRCHHHARKAKEG
jgi:hypothetical protein